MPRLAPPACGVPPAAPLPGQIGAAEPGQGAQHVDGGHLRVQGERPAALRRPDGLVQGPVLDAPAGDLPGERPGPLRRQHGVGGHLLHQRPARQQAEGLPTEPAGPFAPRPAFRRRRRSGPRGPGQ
ncbi:hypothetical protein ACG93S_24735 [Streptomyces sp. WAC01490]|uniref:hypothetical protein n=1 Tax=Streptomyces sp. WAC01490 TaxID=3373093 RepID=UPI003F3E1F0D